MKAGGREWARRAALAAALVLALTVRVAGAQQAGQPPDAAGAQATEAQGSTMPQPTVRSDSSTTVGTVVDDSVLTAKLKSAMLIDPTIKGLDIKIETRKGEVQLSGFVEEQAQIDRALTIARNTEGVKSVDNRMTLKAGTRTVGNVIDDGIITTRVKTALLADPRVKSFDIGVMTRKGAVQLSGFVDSEEQIEQAVSVARAVKGVQGIDNKMAVKH